MTLGACSRSVEVVRDVEYVEGQRLDIHRPESSVESAPVVVLLHGAGLNRRDYEAFASELAEGGVVVFNADWAVLPPTKQVALEQVACAVRFARAESQALGADTDRIVLVGHSTAGVYAGEVATRGDQYTGPCPTEGSALPAALALIAPAQVTGGAPWDLQDLGGNPQLRIGIIHGLDDTVARPSLSKRIESDLREHGYDVDLHLIEGDHLDVVMIAFGDEGLPDRQPGETTIGIILELVRD